MNIREDYLAPITDFLFSIYTRLGLCFFLLFIGPFSLSFRCTTIIIFCLPIVRYFWYRSANKVMENNFGIAVTVISPILYLILFTHILIIYNYPFPVIVIILSIPCAIFFALIKFWPDILDYKNSLLSTMCFYLLPFIFAINYTFDFAKPAVKKYWITNAYKDDFPSSSNDESSSDEYYFYLISADSIPKAPSWQKVDEEIYYDYKSFFSKALAETQFKNYEIIERKKEADHFKNVHYYFLLQEKFKSTKLMVTEQVYYRFQKGGYFHTEKHRGLLGIGWTTYR
jgi:hypothetical protein